LNKEHQTHVKKDSYVKKHKNNKIKKNFKIGLITISTSRYHKYINNIDFSDEAYENAKEYLLKNNCKIIEKRIVDDNKQNIEKSIFELINGESEVIILMGGTGLTKDDITVETMRKLFDREIEGFGELFRQISFKDIGTSVYLTRATAGIIKNKVIYCLPGSPAAVKTALKIIMPELNHILYLIQS